MNFVRLAASAALLLALDARAGDRSAGTTCPDGTASCSVNCSDSRVGFATCICNDTGSGCRCACLARSQDADTKKLAEPLAAPVPEGTLGVMLRWDGPISLEQLALQLREIFGWGVVIVGDATTVLASGSYTGSLESLVGDIGEDHGFAASWDASAGVLTLIVD